MRPKSADVGVCVVLTLVVLRAVEEIERLETHLEANAIGDRRRLREVHVEREQPGPAELVVAVHRGAALEVLADQEVGLGAAVRRRDGQQVVVARRRVALADARLHAVDELSLLLAWQRDVVEVDARRQIDVAGHVPRLAGLVDEHRRHRPAAEEIPGDAALVAEPGQFPHARRGDAVLALREVGRLVQETRDRVHVAADLGPPRHPGVAGVDGDALRPALVRHELRRVVDQLADVVLVLGDAGRTPGTAGSVRTARASGS